MPIYFIFEALMDPLKAKGHPSKLQDMSNNN